MNPAAVPFLFLTFLAAFFGLMIFLSRRQTGRANDSLAGAASRLNLTLNRKPPVLGLFESIATVAGPYRGRNVRFFNYTTGSGKSRTSWSAVAATCSGGAPFSLELATENFLTRLGEKLGMQDIKTGDPAFDQTFVVQSSDPNYAAAALLPEISANLLAQRQAGARGTWRIKDGEVRYSEIGSFGDAGRTERLAAAIETICYLAEIADIYKK